MLVWNEDMAENRINFNFLTELIFWSNSEFETQVWKEVIGDTIIIATVSS